MQSIEKNIVRRTKMEGLLSIIIPSYNEGLLIDNTANVVVDIMTEHKIPYEILFVDDGSKDDT